MSEQPFQVIQSADEVCNHCFNRLGRQWNRIGSMETRGDEDTSRYYEDPSKWATTIEREFFRPDGGGFDYVLKPDPDMVRGKDPRQQSILRKYPDRITLADEGEGGQQYVTKRCGFCAADHIPEHESFLRPPPKKLVYGMIQNLLSTIGERNDMDLTVTKREFVDRYLDEAENYNFFDKLLSDVVNETVETVNE